MQTWDALLDFHGITNQDIKEIAYHEDENGDEVRRVHTEHSDAARRAILRLYTLETPLYRTLNRANSCQDQRAIDTLGPFAWMLLMTLKRPPKDNKEKQGEKVDQETETITLYRGLGLPEDAIQTYRDFLKTDEVF